MTISTFEWFKQEGLTFFRTAVDDGFYSRYLFASVVESRNYVLRDKPYAVYIAESSLGTGELVDVRNKTHHGRVTHFVYPQSYDCDDCDVRYDVDWISAEGISGVKRRLLEAASAMSDKLNTSVVEVISKASSTPHQIKGTAIEASIAEVADLLELRGWHADRLLVPRRYRNRLVNLGIVSCAAEPLCEAHMGTTETGVEVFAFDGEPNDDSMFLFDSKAGLLLHPRTELRFSEQEFHFRTGLLGQIKLSPIIEDTHGVAKLTGLQKGLAGRTPGAVPATSFQIGYVGVSRIEELRRLNSPDFDLQRLVGLCEEINICFANDCNLATIALVRTILNHIPPIFGYPNFKQLASQHPGSVGKSLKQLHSAINIADRHLHQQIRSKETLPTKTQVDYHNDLDALLEAIVAELK